MNTVLTSSSTPGHVSEENENISLKIYMHYMFIAAFFIIAKVQKQLKCPSTDEWIKKTWYIYIYIYIHTTEYHSAI